MKRATQMSAEIQPPPVGVDPPRALIFAEYLPPYLSSDRRIFELARNLVTWRAQFCVLPPIRILGGHREEAALAQYFEANFPASGASRRMVSGMEAHYLPIPHVLRRFWKKWMPLAYALSLPYYVLQGYMFVRSQRPDVIVLAHPSYLTGVVGRLVAWLHRLPVVLDYPDAWTPLAIETSGIRPGGLWARLLYFLERRVVRSVDHVVSITYSLIPYIRAMGCKAKETVVANGADPAMFRPERGNREQLVRAHAIPSAAQIVLYAGRFERWSGVDDFVGLVAKVAAVVPDVVFLVVGDGSGLERLRLEIDHAGLAPNVRFLGLCSYEDMPQIIGSADIAVVPFPLTAATVPCSPIKLFEYMLMNKPIVATNLPGVAESVENTVRLVSEPLNENFCKALVELLEQPDVAADLARRGRELALRSHLWPNLSKKFERVLFAAIGETRSPDAAESPLGVNV